jgi:hypothetical protein
MPNHFTHFTHFTVFTQVRMHLRANCKPEWFSTSN